MFQKAVPTQDVTNPVTLPSVYSMYDIPLLDSQTQDVPLATEPGISLIILTPMKILQRNLNTSTFVVWEMKIYVSAVCVCSPLQISLQYPH